MHLDQLLTGAISLIAALIGASAALTAQYAQLRQARKADAERERKQAIEEVIVRAQAIDLRVNDMMVLAANAGSIHGLLGRVLGSVAPLDYAAMFNSLNVEVNALNRAAAQVWLFGDDETVALANAVSLAATDVVSAHTGANATWVSNLLRVAVFGQPPRDAERIQSAREALGNARRALVEHTRKKLGLAHVDLFAVPTDEPRQL